MSVTLLNQPDDISSAYRPIKWDVQTDRTGSEFVAITSNSGGAGFTRYNHGFGAFDDAFVGDIIIGSGFPDNQYNTRQEIITRSGSFTETNFDPLSPTAGQTGTLTRANDNLQIKGEAHIFTKANINILSVTDLGGGKLSIETDVDHDYKINELAEITETTDYNGIFPITAIIDTTHFEISDTFTNTQTGKVRGATLIGSKRQQLIKIGADELFRFDFSNFLQSALSHDLETLGQTQIISPTPNSIIEYVIQFIEEFDDKDGLIKQASTIITSIKRAVNTTLQHREAQNLNVFTQDNTSKRFLTNTPDKVIAPSEEEQLSFLTNLSQANYNIKTFDAQGVELTSTNKTVQDIENNRGIIPVTPPTPLVYNNFTIKLLDSGATIRSETKKFILDQKCFANPIRFWWLNKLGGFDAFTFTGDIQEAINSRPTIYERDLGFSFNVEDRGETVLGIKAENRLEAFSDFMTRDEAEWLQELYTSPQVLLQEGTDFISIIILSRRQKIFDSDELIQFKIQYKPANELILQTN